MIDSRLLIELGWKSALIAAAALVALELFRSRSAAERSLVAYLGVFAILLLPLGMARLPSLEVSSSPVVAELLGTAPNVEVGPRPRNDDIPAPVAEEVGSALTGAGGLVTAAYALPAFALMVSLLLGIGSLARLRTRSRVLEDDQWLAALAAAQNRLNFKHGAVLMTSDEIAAPVSWGFVRPTIVIDLEAREDVRNAEAIVAHELAHVARKPPTTQCSAIRFRAMATWIFWFRLRSDQAVPVCGRLMQSRPVVEPCIAA
jgi:beta-lactamase regulating signal transducer with metallopeptidase domain